MSRTFKLAFALLLLTGFTGCYLLDQKDYLFTETISNEADEHVFYHLYQTGIDNYTFEFMAANGSDTTKLFDCYLNDAVYGVMKFSHSKIGDTLRIIARAPTNSGIARTSKGTVVVLEDIFP